MSRVVATVLGVMLLVSCSGGGERADETTPAPSPTGENSAFTDAGIERAIDDGTASLDLRGPLTTKDLGATTSEPVRDLEVSGDEDPIELTVLGNQGELVVEAESIRLRVEPKTKRVRTISVFEEQEDTDALVQRLREVGPLVGVDTPALASYLSLLAGSGTQDVWLKDAGALGFMVDLHPVHKQTEDSFVEYRLTPPA